MSEGSQDPKEWIRQSIVDETHRRMHDAMERKMERRSCMGGARNLRITIACAAIALGVLLFLGNVGILPAYNFWVLWPVIPMAVGLSQLASQRGPKQIWGVFLVLGGAFFLGVNLGWFPLRGDWVFPLILIGVGCLALMNVLDSTRGFHPRRAIGTNIWRRGMTDHNSSVADIAVLGSVKRKMDTANFQGGDLTSILGSIEIDLRPAMIAAADPGRMPVLNATAIFGAVKLRVPQHWRIHLRGVSLLGNFEDKTVPPNTGVNAPVLVITGWSVFGSVEIED